ncbi:MAG: carboxypeptidase regulatory-like domain-containing protein [Pyrinomonadaceae bacterium]|nr:carboxypeptidase regulatory-like domain-containing protein [Pyrinomonadaceae bacterium]
MHKETDLVDRLRIASPCPTSWESMQGDNRVRFCELCKLNVYNISELTRKQAEELIARTEGRLCARLHKRADGTVITKDCPVGLRAIRRRVSRMAGATMTAVLSFCFGVLGQNRSQEDKSCPGGGHITVTRQINAQGQADPSLQLKGVVKDPNGAVVEGAIVEIVNQASKKKLMTVTDDKGIFRAHSIETGSYTMQVIAAGFQSLTFKNFSVQAGEAIDFDITIGVSQGVTVMVGGAMGDSWLDTNTGIKTTFSPDKITKLPF